MSDIDPEKLEEAITVYGEASRGLLFNLIMAAARAHLATLPRFKEVEVEAFTVFTRDGEVAEIWLLEEDARYDAEGIGGTVVRLTGTAKVKVQP